MQLLCRHTTGTRAIDTKQRCVQIYFASHTSTYYTYGYCHVPNVMSHGSRQWFTLSNVRAELHMRWIVYTVCARREGGRKINSDRELNAAISSQFIRSGKARHLTQFRAKAKKIIPTFALRLGF